MKASVLGAGSWGTTLALILNENKHEVKCWSYEKKDINTIRESGENKRFLPGVKIPKTILFSDNLTESIHGAQVVVVAVPSHAVRSVVEKLGHEVNRNAIWISVAKGIENESFLRISQVIGQAGKIPGENLAVLSGPSHAEEVSRQVPTAIVAASTFKDTAVLVQNLFMLDLLQQLIKLKAK